MGFDPTPEQHAIVDAFKTGGDLVVTAGAGSGKTSTMRLLAEATPDRKGLYGAFNKSAQTDAARSFPRHVTCVTSAALARRYIVSGWGGDTWDARMNVGRQTGREQAQILGITGPHRIGPQKVLAPNQVARIAMETMQKFCYSADEKISRRHVPHVNGCDQDAERNELVATVVPIARAAWDNASKPAGTIKLTFDVAMKVWGLSGDIQLPYEYVVLDEAQDSNPVWAQIVAGQQCQKVVVGDSCQQLYSWRGAVDSMAAFPAEHRLTLSQSFRFGPAIAEEANKWLTLLDAELRITGYDKIPSVVHPVDAPRAVLTRTNAEAMSSVMDFQAHGTKVALVGGGDPIRKLAEAALELKERGSTWHPELCAFTSWGQVQDYCENDHGGSDLAVLVRLIDAHGPHAVIAAATRTVDERDADVTVSTAHKAKGREWDSLLIASDFPEPKKDEDGNLGEVGKPDGMLAYVAVTRAKLELDRLGLAWVDHYLTAPPAPTVAVAPAALGGQWRVVAVDGRPLTAWSDNYYAMCAELRSRPDADRMESDQANAA